MGAAAASALAAIPFRRAAADPDGRCLLDATHTLTNAQFASAVRRLADRFVAAGVGEGSTIGVMLPNCVEIVTSMFAAWYLGAALTPINPALTDDEVAYQLDDSTSVLVVGDERAHRLAGRLDIAWVDAAGIHDGPDGAETVHSAEPVATQDDFALVIYTSGTTGRPKGVLLDHANLDAMSASLIEHFALSATDTSLLILPLFHVNGLVASVVSPLRAGGDVVVSAFSLSGFWDAVERYRPTYFSAVPTIYALLEARTERDVDTSSLRFVVCGAAPMPLELIERFERRFGVVLVEGYGLSEGSVASTINPIDARRKPGTVGVALPGQQVAVVDAAGRSVPAGERGEVVIRGANVMRGYLGRPEETARTVRDGWLHTGDVGTLDGDGFLRIVDRLKDMIIRGGENIYPKEIEECLYAHPGVLEAAVVGQPDPVLGEVPVAYVAARPGADVTAEELVEYCAAALAGYKVPVRVWLRDELPKNSVGKIMKNPLRDEAVSADA